MAIAYRSSSSNTNFPGTTPLSVNKPTGTVSGDILVAVVNSQTAYATSSGWTQRATLTSAFGPFRITVLTLVAGGSEPASYSFAAAGGTIQAAAISAYSGGDAASPIDGTATTSEDSDLDNVIVLPSVTTTVNNSIIVGCIAPTDTAVAYIGTAPPGSMTERIDINTSAAYAVEMADQTITPAGATGTRSFTITATPGNTIVLGALIGLKNNTGTPATVIAVQSTATAQMYVPAAVTGKARVVAPRSTASSFSGTSVIRAGTRQFPPQSTATAQMYVPAVVFGQHVLPPKSTADAVAYVPVVSSTQNPIVLAVSAVATAQMYAPTVSIRGNVDAPAMAADGIAYPPTVSATRVVTISGVQALATAQGYTPTISVSITTAAPIATASAQAYAPVLITNNVLDVPEMTATGEAYAPFVGVVIPAEPWTGGKGTIRRTTPISGTVDRVISVSGRIRRNPPVRGSVQ